MAVVVLATVITMLEGYPWITLQKDDSLVPTNPYKFLFYITNEGYFPATNVDVSCSSSFRASNGNVFRDNIGQDSIAGPIWHSQKRFLRCTQVLQIGNEPTLHTFTLAHSRNPTDVIEADMAVTVSRAICWINIRPLRVVSTFHMHAVRKNDGTFQWTYQ
ncbi:MAG: hypothetical protein JST28_00875 [Acidobacteria bacterium]|nr:hypothetical protein [Acidobacteriota bacterium]